MPSHPGWQEAMIGVSLLAGGSVLAMRIYAQQPLEQFLRQVGVLMFLIGIPLLTGLWHRQGINNLVRDLFPALFLVAIPALVSLSLAEQASSRKMVRRVLLATIVLVGMISSLHCLIGIHHLYGTFAGFIHQMSGAFHQAGELAGELVVTADKTREAYVPEAAPTSTFFPLDDFKALALLAYEPAVLFTASYAPLALLESLLSVRRRAFALIWLLPALLCNYTLALFALRAPMILVVTTCLIFAVRNIRWQRTRIVYLLAGGAIVTVSGVILFADLIRLTLVKQHAVGANGKITELLAVLEQAQSSLSAFLLGTGWGGVLSNPIYQSEATRFTHSLLSFLLLKCGLIGLIGLLGWYAYLCSHACSRATAGITAVLNSKIYLAGGSTLLVGLLLQPTYKMLGFSMVLALLLVGSHQETEGATR